METIAIFSTDPVARETDLLVLGLPSGAITHAAFKALDGQLSGALKAAVADHAFKGELGQSFVMHTLGMAKPKKIALVGLGAAKDIGARSLVAFGGASVKLANSIGAKTMSVVFGAGKGLAGDQYASLARGLHLGGYRFDRFRSEPGRAAGASSSRGDGRRHRGPCLLVLPQ